ncbi:hypothetical protein PF005_g14987 [Phytophthora fragariae]|uniref:Uncharacterized protein n=3 Tax=Phytophthora fragariae TaxID=53985 RepID=A0A6A3XFZ4_9STRA|nr:hypothetical protein PF005_g14987 [Phytophthora fragariae]
MPPKCSARSAKAPSKPRAVGPKTRAAKAKYVSSALKEATETAEEAVRSRSSTAEGERWSRSRSKTPEATSGKEESPQPYWRRAACPTPPPFTTAPSEQGAGDIERIDDDEKQVGDNTTIADTEAVAGMSPSDTAGSKPKAYPPIKRLTLAQGRECAQASKAAVAAKVASAAKAGEASAKKRAAPSSSPGGSNSKLFSDSESENEVGAIREHREVSSDLDEQQQYHAAASGSHARQSDAATAVGSSSVWGARDTSRPSQAPERQRCWRSSRLRMALSAGTHQGVPMSVLSLRKSHSFLATLKSPGVWY